MSGITVPDDTKRPPWSMTLGEMLDRVVSQSPHKVYLCYQNYQVTYEEFLSYTLKAANLFHELGVKHGDRVCTFLPNGREFPFIWMGLARLGAVCVRINTAYKQSEMAFILNDSEAKALVSHHTLMDVAQEAARMCPSLQDSLVVKDGGEAHPGWKDFWTMLREASPAPSQTWPDVKPNDLSMLVYTSGTTGNPKGVMITHEMYVAAGQGFATWTEATPDDRFITRLPYFHANAQYYSTMGSLAAGASLILEDRFSASRFWDQVRESRATVVNFIGMMMPVLLKQPPAENDRDNSVRVFYGSPALGPEVLAEFEERFGATVQLGFGMTETCYGTIERLGLPHRRGSSGQPRWHPDSRFRNEMRSTGEDGSHLPHGQVGEITIRNPAVMPGYWRNPERTRESLKDGWLHTGDLGWMDEDGYLYFVDRKKDVVRRRGENISSQEVEDVIKRHPGVLDCAVIAVPSDLGEEEVKAYVVNRPFEPTQETGHEPQGGLVDLSPEEVIYWCAERLAHFKVPRYVEFRDDMPRTPSFRIRKDMLRQEREDLTIGCFDRERAGIQLRR
ncbi:MAG: ATP-dependent acyl-CoA ligase [Dehalococcoidia bacterium]|nr:ATP-dependent acyl-CoA ligase [Dehalococcoidia bacterium]